MNKLVQSLKDRGIIRNAEIEQVMAKVDRADFCPNNCYEDAPQLIGENATISAPHMHAFALEAALPFIDPEKSQRVLDVGSGSGYLCVAFAKLLGPKSKVYGIDHMQSLIDKARLNTQKNHSDLLENFQIYFVSEDGRKGFLPGSPYDIVHVGASSAEVPQALIDQTKTGGIIIIPMGDINSYQVMKIYRKSADGSIDDINSDSCLVRYIPLTDISTQKAP